MHKLSDADLEIIELDVAWRERESVGIYTVPTEQVRTMLNEIRESRKSDSTHGAHRIAKAVQGKGSV